MPGSVPVATVSLVLPYTLCSVFEETRTWLSRISQYRDGNYEAATTMTVSRKAWRLAKRLTYTQWTALLSFWESTGGTMELFYFYPIQSQYDATGTSTTGRWIVRFDGTIVRSYDMGRVTVNLQLVQAQ